MVATAAGRQTLRDNINDSVLAGFVIELGVSGAVSYLIVRYAALPLLPAASAYMDTLFPDAFKEFYYDPVGDRMCSLMLLSSLLGYLIMAVGICTFLDCLPTKWTEPFKAQGHKSYFSVGEWLQAAGVGSLNLVFFSFFATIPIYQIQKSGILRGWTPMATEEDEFDVMQAVGNMIIHALVIEFWFYWTHYVLHWPIFYKAIHKFHHRFKAPTAVACVYANPIEFCCGNVAGVVLGPAVTNCHPYTAAFWMAFSLVSTSMAHSGYLVFGCDKHDLHHEHFDYNFGTNGLMDKLFGTDFAGSLRDKAIRAKIERNRLEKVEQAMVLQNKLTVDDTVDGTASGGGATWPTGADRTPQKDTVQERERRSLDDDDGVMDGDGGVGDACGEITHALGEQCVQSRDEPPSSPV